MAALSPEQLIVAVLVGIQHEIGAAVENALIVDEVQGIEQIRRGGFQIQLLLGLVHVAHLVDPHALDHRIQPPVGVIQGTLDGLHVMAGNLVHRGHEVVAHRGRQLRQIHAGGPRDQQHRYGHDGDVLSSVHEHPLVRLMTFSQRQCNTERPRAQRTAR